MKLLRDSLCSDRKNLLKMSLWRVSILNREAEQHEKLRVVSQQALSDEIQDKTNDQ